MIPDFDWLFVSAIANINTGISIADKYSGGFEKSLGRTGLEKEVRDEFSKVP